jgi:peptide/nickel transport system substrate-binding protein
VPYEPHGFNEVYRNYTGGGGYFVANNVFNRLVVIDVFGDGAIRPDLAERWEVLEGGATYRFHLRDARWHDGRPLCAEDVRETYLTAIRERYRAAASLGDVRDVVVRGERTVDIELHRPNSGFLAQLSIFVWTHILPAHIYAGTDWTTNAANDRPVGTGPYRFVEWRRGEGVRIEANPDYHNGRPAIDEVEYRVVPDLADALEMLKRGKIDFATQDVPCERYDEMAAAAGVGIARGSGNAVNHITFNCTRSPWSDRRVREAVARMADREALASSICSVAQPFEHAYLEHVQWAFDPEARFPSYDPAAAAALLDAAGFGAGADGVRLRTRLAARKLFPFHVRMASELVTSLRKVGIAVELETLDAVAWQQRVQTDRDFDLLVDGLGIGPDPVLFEEVLLSDAVLNVSGFKSAALDDAFRRGKAAPDRHARAAAYKEAQRIVAREMPRVHIIRHVNHLAYRTRWAGWSWEPPVRGTLPFWSLERIRRSASAGTGD